MYANFYNLVEEPFPVTPDPKYLFLSDSHKEAIASIVYGIENRRGFVAIVGEVGTGKTTILRAYLDAIEKSKFSIIYVFNPQVSFDELVVYIADELGIATLNTSTPVLVTQIHRALIKEYENNRTVVLIIDEAQNTPIATLESIRMLSNIETDQHKLLQIVLVGQPELQQLLGRHELRQLNQRIAVKSTILPLSQAESRQYIKDRLEAVSLDKQQIFEDAALAKIVAFAGGIPRMLNITCDTALINGYGHSARPVTKHIVQESISTLRTPGAKSGSMYRKVGGAAAATVLVALSAWAFLDFPGKPTVAVKPPVPAPETITQSSVPTAPINRQKPVSADDPGDSAPVFEKTAALAKRNAGAAEIESDRERSLPANESALVNTSPAIQNSAPVVNGTDKIIKPESLLVGQSSDLDLAVESSGSVRGSESSIRVKWDPRTLPDQGFPMTRVVKADDVISQMCIDVYGFAIDELYEFLQVNNPELVDVNEVSTGSSVLFPPLTHELQLIRSAAIKRKIRLKGLPAGISL